MLEQIANLLNSSVWTGVGAIATIISTVVLLQEKLTKKALLTILRIIFLTIWLMLTTLMATGLYVDIAQDSTTGSFEKVVKYVIATIGSSVMGLLMTSPIFIFIDWYENKK